MFKKTYFFLGMFLVGAVLALVVRAALFNPHSNHTNPSAAGGEYVPLVSNSLAPTKAETTPTAEKSTATPAADPHASHNLQAVLPATSKPVNTLCAICGMDVDPKLPTAQYQGKTIGFGCRMCPAKFKAEPDRYGPAYLRNEVINP